MRSETKKNLWQDRPVLVTGGAGFIGSWLSYTLFKKKARVVIIDKKEILPPLGGLWDELRSSVSYVSGDIRDSSLLSGIFKKYKIKTVFHLAAEAIVGNAYLNPAEALDTNVRGTWTVLDECRQENPEVEIVVASSDKAYGSHSVLPYKEDFPLLGENPYDCSKSAADRIAQMYAKSYGLNIAVTRCGNVYGGGDLNFSRLIPDTVRAIFLKKRPEIRSDGLYRRDYIYVSDIVNAYIGTAESLIKKEILGGSTFNFGTQKPHTALEVVRAISNLMNVELQPIVLATAEYEIRDQYLDSEKAKKVLGWAPVVGFDDGLKDTVYWYTDYFSRGKSLST